MIDRIMIQWWSYGSYYGSYEWYCIGVGVDALCCFYVIGIDLIFVLVLVIGMIWHLYGIGFGYGHWYWYDIGIKMVLVIDIVN